MAVGLGMVSLRAKALLPALPERRDFDSPLSVGARRLATLSSVGSRAGDLFLSTAASAACSVSISMIS
jgi:hypothetical protein